MNDFERRLVSLRPRRENSSQRDRMLFEAGRASAAGNGRAARVAGSILCLIILSVGALLFQEHRRSEALASALARETLRADTAVADASRAMKAGSTSMANMANLEFSPNSYLMLSRRIGRDGLLLAESTPRLPAHAAESKETASEQILRSGDWPSALDF